MCTWGVLGLSGMMDSCHQAFEQRVPWWGWSDLAGQSSPQLDVNLAKHVIRRKLVGGETEIGRFIEVMVTWTIIYRISGK